MNKVCDRFTVSIGINACEKRFTFATKRAAMRKVASLVGAQVLGGATVQHDDHTTDKNYPHLVGVWKVNSEFVNDGSVWLFDYQKKR